MMGPFAHFRSDAKTKDHSAMGDEQVERGERGWGKEKQRKCNQQPMNMHVVRVDTR